MKSKLSGLIFLGILVLLTAAWAIPKLFISTNVDIFGGEQKIFAFYALKASRQLIGGSLEPLIVTALKVTDVKESASESMQQCGQEPYVVSKPYEATVQSYTVFGVPYRTILVTCTTAGKISR